METSNNGFTKDPLLLSGIGLILVSFLIFLLPDLGWIHLEGDSFFGLFFINYVFSGIFLLLLLIRSFMRYRWSLYTYPIEYTLLLLILYLISAFSLNREIPVFEKSTDWVCVFLTVQCLTLIGLVFRQRLPAWINAALHLLLGMGMLLYVYYTVYLFPLYPICFVGGIFLGISLHVFTPICFVVFTLLLVRKTRKEHPVYVKLFVTGLILPMIVAAVFLVEWNATRNKVNYRMNQSMVADSDLPSWVQISKSLPTNSITEKMLKTDLVYTTADANQQLWGWNIPGRSFDEVKLHDPLVVLATLFIGTPDLSETEKINILEAMYDSRHQAQERLWSGDDLKTVNVISNISIFPEYRLAYTEKILSIHNDDTKTRWRNQQEAIYTFHLPEGSVVTSLSLWIEGNEEKGILTSKHTADSAYKTIVGVERRDPSIVHWQEGNTVSVRVFPCTPSENRKVKIGITSPLRSDSGHLTYENIYFDGPSASGATESVNLKFTATPRGMVWPFNFTSGNGNTYQTEKTYTPYWELSFDAPKLSPTAFSLHGESYTVDAYSPTSEAFQATEIYLDLNNTWTKAEFTTIWEQIQSRKVYVAKEEQLVQLTHENKDQLFAELQADHFSLFPVYLVQHPSQALIVSKSSGISPNLRDLKDSEFSKKLTAYINSHSKVRLYTIGFELSPYLKTLKELRVFVYGHGSTQTLVELMQKQQFPKYAETDSTIVIDHAELLIHKQQATTTGTAPDHLLRVFAYNDIMRKTGGSYLTGTYINEELIREAEYSYVVSPVSSLLVLESRADYERFGITNNHTGLQNASMKSSGAVPEPHEWLLIILAGFSMLYLVFRSKFQSVRL